MALGYSLIALAAICWGLSATWARHLITSGQTDASQLSQTRVFFAWVILVIGIAMFNRKLFRIPLRDLPRFAVLGIIGMAGANFFLYWAISHMNAALADLIQFMAPAIVVVWMWARKLEPLDKPKVTALAMSLVGCALALGVTGSVGTIPPLAVASACASAVCFASVMILGKKISASYSMPTYLNYALLSASLFWFIATPSTRFVNAFSDVGLLATLVVFAVTSILLPYSAFFLGLQRVPASRAGIVSTLEPVVVALGSWVFLSEGLTATQVVGMGLVVAAIILIETTSPLAVPQVADSK